jgi:PKD repeat protein
MKSRSRINFFISFCLLSLLSTYSFAQSTGTSVAFSLISPKADQYFEYDVPFYWNKLDSADSYRLLISNDQSFSIIMLDSTLLQNSFQIILNKGTHYWKVYALSSGIKIDSTLSSKFNVFSPRFINGLSLWLVGDSVTTINGKVNKWVDQSDSASVVEQTVANNQPSYIVNGLNGYGVVDFDVSKDFFNNVTTINDSNYYISALYSFRSSFKPTRLLSGPASGSNWVLGPYLTRHRLTAGGPFVGPGLQIERDRFVINRALASGSVLHHHVNNVQLGTGPLTNIPGSISISSSTNNYMNGSVAEIIIIDNSVSIAQADSIDKYLLDKYAPPLDLGENLVVCQFPVKIGNSRDYILSYSWSTASTDSIIDVAASGKYFVTSTDIFGRTFVDSIVVSQFLESFNDFLPNDTTLCAGDTLEIGVNSSELFSYSWNTGNFGQKLTVDSSGLYILTVINCLGQISKDSINISFNRPEFSLGNDTSICFNDSIVLLPDSNFIGVNYNWNNSSASNQLIVSASGVYKLTVTDAFFCQFEDSIRVTSDSILFDIDIGPDTSLCFGNRIGLLNPIPGIDSYLWSTNSSDSSIQITAAQKYYLTITNNGCKVIDSADISVKGLAPQAGFNYSNQCFNDSIQFADTSVSIGGISLNSWNWNFGDGNSSNVQNPNYLYNAPGVFTVQLTVVNDSNCSSTAAIPVTIFPKPVAAFSNIISCAEDSTFFNNTSSIANGSIINYKWDFGDNSTMIDTSIIGFPFYIYPTSGNHLVELKVESDRGCRDTIVLITSTNPSPQPLFNYMNNYINDSVRFINNSSINSGTINSFSWNFGNGLLSVNANPKSIYTQLGKYEVSLQAISVLGCTKTFKDSVEITLPPPPAPVFDIVLPKINQTLSGNVDFIWNVQDSANAYLLQVALDSTFQNMIVNKSKLFHTNYFENLAEGYYYWRVIALDSLVTIDTSNLGSFSVIDVKNTDSLDLWLRSDTGVISTNGAINSWLDFSDSAKVLTQPLSNRQPSLIANGLNGFDLVDFDISRDLFSNVVNVSKNNYFISILYNFHETTSRPCRLLSSPPTGSNWLIGPYFRHQLTTGGPFIGNGIPIVKDRFVLNSAYSIADSVSHRINNLFLDKGITNGIVGDLTLGSTFQFMNGSIAEIIVIDGSVSENRVIDIEKYLLDKYAPPVNLGQDIKTCSYPQKLSAYKDSYLSYSWSTGESDSIIAIDSSGKYVVTVTDIFNRISVDSMFFVLDTFNYQVDLSFNDTTICLGDSVQINTGNSRFVYNWNNGFKGSSIFLKNQRSYVVTQTNCLGTTSQDSLSITVNSPEFNLGADTTTCFNSIISLSPDSTFSNVSYIWSTNEIVSSVVANLSNAYSLTVTDNFLCSFSDTVTVTIDSSIFGITLGPDTSLCRGNIIGLLNQPAAISSYNWSTSETSAFATIDTSGSYKVEVGNGRCLISDTIEIVVKGDAPVVDFSFSNLCFKDSLMFVDNSVVPTGDTLKYWSWEFGNGDSSIVSDPKYKYSNRSDYVVFLKVETNRGCADTISKVIRIEPLPNANFNFQNNNACAKARIFHQDSSFIGRGFVNKYFWNFGDSNSIQNTSISKDPFHTYDTLGNYSVKLIIESDQGCKDSISKTITVHPTPNVNFVVNNFCISDSVGLQDATVFAGADTLNYFWTIRKIGSSFTVDRRQNPKIKINTAGLYDIGLRVRNNLSLNEWCEVNKKDTIEFFNSPIADFNIPKICENDSFSIINMSTSIDSLIDYRFILDNRDTVKIPDANFEGLPNGNYSLRLKVINNKSCADSIQKVFEVFSKPEVGFTILNNNTGIPFSVDLDNRTTNAISYIWDFGNGDTSHLRIPEFTYSDTGTYRLNLIATSIEGCTDSAHQELYALLKFLDASLDKLFLIENNLGGITVSFQIVNTGFNTIRSLLVAADLNNDFQFRESYDTKVYAGRKEGFEMETSFIPDAGKKIDFVCVRIIQVNEELDSITQNNELCESGYNNEFTLKLYPNPVDDFLHLQYTIPDDGVVDLQFFDVLGRRMDIGINLIQEEGYYASVIDLSRFNRGIYFYRFSFSGNTKKGSILKK